MLKKNNYDENMIKIRREMIYEEEKYDQCFDDINNDKNVRECKIFINEFWYKYKFYNKDLYKDDPFLKKHYDDKFKIFNETDKYKAGLDF